MWEFAAEVAVQAYNVTPYKSINYQIPTLKFRENARCNFDQLRRFGCIAYVKLPKKESKFKAVSIKTILVGYLPTGYLLWHPSSRKFIESKHVRFLEKLVYKDVYSREHNPSEITHFIIESQPNERAELREKDYSIRVENSEKEKTKPRKRGRLKKVNEENKLENKINKDTPSYKK